MVHAVCLPIFLYHVYIGFLFCNTHTFILFEYNHGNLPIGLIHKNITDKMNWRALIIQHKRDYWRAIIPCMEVKSRAKSLFQISEGLLSYVLMESAKTCQMCLKHCCGAVFYIPQRHWSWHHWLQPFVHFRMRAIISYLNLYWFIINKVLSGPSMAKE